MTVTKKDIVMKISEETGLKQIHVKKVVQKTFDHIIDILNQGQSIELRNFGVFKVRVRKGRMGRNPRTGAQVPIPDKKVVTFKPGLVMKEKMK
jgi:nucleoid DNA-binding protein